MNTLSWLIYLAGVSQALYIVAGILCFIMGGITLYKVLSFLDRRRDDEDLFDYKYFRKEIIVAGVCVLIFITIPARSTIYMIAASEISEYAITDPKNIEIFNLLRDRVKEGLREPQ